jgi:ribosomal protein S18 acetylase RimI-like enzyme
MAHARTAIQAVRKQKGNNRMVQEKQISRLEEISMNSWPSLKNEIYDGWILRYSNGYTKRANSVIPLYKSSLPIYEKIELCREKYLSNNLPLIFKLTELNNDIDEILDNNKFNKIDISKVKAINVNIIENQTDANVIISNRLEKEWIDAYFEISNLQEKEKQLTSIEMLNRIPGLLITCLKKFDQKIVGVGLGIIDTNYLGLFDIIVDEKYRRNGYGKDIVLNLLAEAKRRKINNAYLQVVENNKAANSLYDKIGFKDVYRYWYRKEEAIHGQ